MNDIPTLLDRLAHVRSLPRSWEADCPCGCGGRLTLSWQAKGLSFSCTCGCQEKAIRWKLGLEPARAFDSGSLLLPDPPKLPGRILFYAKEARTADLFHRMGFPALSDDFGGLKELDSISRSTRLVILSEGTYSQAWKEERIRTLKGMKRRVLELRMPAGLAPKCVRTAEDLCDFCGMRAAAAMLADSLEAMLASLRKKRKQLIALPPCDGDSAAVRQEEAGTAAPGLELPAKEPDSGRDEPKPGPFWPAVFRTGLERLGETGWFRVV